MNDTALAAALTDHLARFGLSSFRPGQHEVISAVLAGRDCLCIMPTGGGKSLCYQLPAVARPGVTLVVSPLIALMKDQVDALLKLGLRATFINSSLSLAEQRERLDALAAGGYDLVYVAPERFRHGGFVDSLSRARLQLLAVDEAHCVSEWGHDFRPDYARLGQFRRRLGLPQTIALTATATPTVRRDVIESLGLREPATFVTGFARPNLEFSVEHAANGGAKQQRLFEFLDNTPGAGIIYAATRKRCEEVVEFLRGAGRRRSAMYHAGLEPDLRRRTQEDFMAGKIETIVATNAFGMGIDKSDLRYVVHYNLPGTLEAYYQEAGRAGRDGQPSRCLLLYTPQDRYVQEFFIDNNYPPREAVAAVYEFLCTLRDDPIELTQEEIKGRLGISLSSEGVGSCEKILEKAGALERLDPRQNMASVRIDSELPTLVDLLPQQARKQRRVLHAMERLVGPRRGERVYFAPGDAASRAELDPDAFHRALRELSKLEAFDYVPPFRGKAVHLLRPDTPFEQLVIDFEELNRRRAAEFEKLDRVVHYALSRRCRQQEILGYFGEQSDFLCGGCDSCRRNGVARPATGPASTASDKPPASAPTGAPANAEPAEALVDALRMALSGVARTKGKFGKQVVAQMLFGSKAGQLEKWRMHQLSTYGLLSGLQLKEVTELLDAALAVGLVRQEEIERFRPIVQLTPHGEAVMRGEETPPTDLRLSPTLHAKLASGAWRRTPSPAAAAPTSPASRAAPTSKAAVGAASAAADLGAPQRREPPRPPRVEPPPEAVSSHSTPARAERIDPPQAPRGAAPPPTAAANSTAAPADAASGPHYWTWRLLADGYPPADCLAIRGIDDATLMAHLARALEAGLAIEPAWFVTNAEQGQLERVADASAAPSPRALSAYLGQRLPLERAALWLKWRGQSRQHR